MRQIVTPAVLVFVGFLQAPTLPTPQRGAQPPQVTQPAQTAPKKAPPKAPAKATPMTLRQVIEGLSSLKSSSRVEAQIAKAGGVQFKATPEVVDILLEFGAGPKLISMIPSPPRPPATPARKAAGPLTIVCEPKDCAVAVDQKYSGATSQNRRTITDLPPAEATIEVFAEGYEPASRRVQLDEKPKEEKFVLKRSALARQQIAGAALLKAVAGLGGTDGISELADIEGSGVMEWTNNSGQVEQWQMTFNKHIGRDLVATYKTKDGQCNASIVLAAEKQDCKGGLKNGGDKIASQGTSLFLSYQPQDVLNALMKRELMTSEGNDNELESVEAKDSYVLTLARDGSPTDLIYKIGESQPVQVQYSNYLTLNNARYPGRIAIGRVKADPVWVFTVKSLKSKVGKPQ
jgi:hypothetical protein